MAEEKRADDVEKLLSEQKTLDDRKQSLIDDLLQQKAEAIKVFDEKLAKLGYRANSSGKTRKSHHKQASPAADAPAKPAAKPKA